jgi:hypothetical protein
MKCDRKHCETTPVFLIGTARIPVCERHAEEWLSKCFKKPEKQKEMRERFMVRI